MRENNKSPISSDVIRGVSAIAKKASKSKNKSDFTTAYNSINTDPQGSWTGVPEDPYDKPIQDADDL